MKRFVNRQKINKTLLSFFGFFLISCFLSAEIRLPSVIGNYMVLQQNQPIKIWGWADPGERISLTFANQKKQALTDTEGRWRITFKAMKAGGGPLRMTINGTKSEPIILNEILLGEVWVCSGQSNMEWSLLRTQSPTPEILRADHPSIRLLHVPRRVSTEPLENVDADWKVCGPETVGTFSAVAYYFGRELHLKLGVPVGLINSSWGGTKIEPWIPVSGFESVPEVAKTVEEIKAAKKEYRNKVKAFLPELEEWLDAAKGALLKEINIPVRPEMPRHPFNNAQSPTALYNGMIHALTPFSIRGAIWYQGEANRNDGLIYARKMEALIKGWRNAWQVGDFPFYYVQLAPFNYAYSQRDDGNDVPDFFRLPLIWEAQLEALNIRNTGMAVITDITNLYDIHPRNKKDVGYRLALWALAKTYDKKDLVYSGPIYRSVTIEGNKIRIHFDYVGSGLTSLNHQPLSWFEIAGKDRTFYKAKAEIDGKTVLVWNESVKEPAAVRFGWHQLAVPNLGNKEGLPASPFRTDRWLFLRK